MRGGRRPGTPKTGGRVKGTPNKRSLRSRDDLWAYIAQCGDDANPFKRMVDRMMSTENEAIEIACAQALADRLLPKLKAIEISGDDAHPLRLLLEHLDQVSDAALHQLIQPEAPLGLPHETA
jgi:hypothetical protein